MPDDVVMARDRGARVLQNLKRYRGMTDTDMASMLGVSRSKVQGYMAGTTQLTIEMMDGFARVLDVDPSVFFMTPDDALRWTIDHRPGHMGRDHRGQRVSASRWIAEPLIGVA